MAQNIVTFLFALTVFGITIYIVSMEYYYRKTKVSAVSSIPWMRKAVIEIMEKQIYNHRSDSPKGENLTLYELGSGWGTLAFSAARIFPESKIVGIEYMPIPYMYSIIKNKFLGFKNLTLKRMDFYDQDLSDADVLFFYLTEPILETLRPKLERELKPGTLLIANTFKIRGWEPIHIETIMEKPLDLKVYAYKVPEVSSLFVQEG